MSSEKIKTKSGELLFVVFFVLLAAFLASQIPEETKWFKRTKWASQPALWPIIGVLGMLGFGALHLITRFRKNDLKREQAEALIWLRSLEFAAWFMIYVWTVPKLGYLPMTLILAPLLCFRMGYRSAKILWAAAGTGFLIVLVFKTFLEVKIPGAAVYEYLPAALRNFMILNF